jgi:hypothetical protein
MRVLHDLRRRPQQSRRCVGRQCLLTHKGKVARQAAKARSL